MTASENNAIRQMAGEVGRLSGVVEGMVLRIGTMETALKENAKELHNRITNVERNGCGHIGDHIAVADAVKSNGEIIKTLEIHAATEVYDSKNGKGALERRLESIEIAIKKNPSCPAWMKAASTVLAGSMVTLAGWMVNKYKLLVP